MWDGATVVGSVSKTKTLCSFSSFQTPVDTSNILYTERRRLAPEYMGSNTHTHQRTQLTIVTTIIEREFVATAILSYKLDTAFRCFVPNRGALRLLYRPPPPFQQSLPSSGGGFRSLFCGSGAKSKLFRDPGITNGLSFSDK